MAKLKHGCPDCSNPVVPISCEITFSDGGYQRFNGWLCGKCRKIFSPTKIDDSIDLRMVL